MLTLPIKNAAGDVTSWKVPLDDERALHVLKQHDGGLVVIDGEVTRVVEAKDVDDFLKNCRNCLSYEHLMKLARWK